MRMRKCRLFFVILLAPLASRGAYVSPGSAIDNVQNYSSNPFYSMDGAYNQRFPTPVYLKGPQLGASECISVVESAIWTQCSFRNNCANAALADIRPGVILELSNRTDNNYSTACAGYIDELFNQYRQRMAGAVASANFPAAGRPANYGGAAPANPLSYYNQMPQWEVDQEIRKGQLRNLQAQNAAPAGLAAASMPSTFEDLSFTERMDIIREGWQDPAVGGGKKISSFHQIENLENDKTMLARQKEELDARNELLKKNDFAKYCQEHPYDKECSNYWKGVDRDKWCEFYPAECEAWKKAQKMEQRSDLQYEEQRQRETESRAEQTAQPPAQQFVSPRAQPGKRSSFTFALPPTK